jgi:hypothetical protein
MLSKMHYVAIARVISDAALIDCPTRGAVQMNADVRRRIAYELADLFARDNARFDRRRFLVACGQTPPPVAVAS